MNKKYIIIIMTCVVLIIGAFVLVTVTTMSTPETTAETETTGETTVESGADASEESAKSASTSDSSDKAAAEKLIDETLTREEVESSLGECDKFEMSSAGCERGVYAGRFYYKDFTIFSRTYDKGKTFHIVSINE